MVRGPAGKRAPLPSLIRPGEAAAAIRRRYGDDGRRGRDARGSDGHGRASDPRIAPATPAVRPALAAIVGVAHRRLLEAAAAPSSCCAPPPSASVRRVRAPGGAGTPAARPSSSPAGRSARRTGPGEARGARGAWAGSGGGQRGEMGGGGEGVDGAALQAARPKSPREREQEKHQKAQTIIKELLRGGPPPQRAGAGPPSYGARR